MKLHSTVKQCYRSDNEQPGENGQNQTIRIIVQLKLSAVWVTCAVSSLLE